MKKSTPARYITALSLLILTILLFKPAENSGFLSLDDDVYILHNYTIHSGLSLENLKWAFSTFYASNWHPVTWISHMVDIQIFGLEPAGHHRTGILTHALNTVVLFFLFVRFTKLIFPGAIVALLFGCHSLHTEPVIWLSERKEILSTLFGLLALFSYAGYSETKRPVSYIATIVLFSLSLLSKPTLVTFPFLLLLLDFWPLNRFSDRNSFFSFPLFKKLLREKIPFFILTLFSCIITIKAQGQEGALQSLQVFSLSERLGNALYSYMRYGLHTLFPFNLSLIYPHPGNSIPVIKLILSAFIILSITLYAVKKVKTSPWFLTGWFWFLGTLVPTIGLVQVGGQAMADRYTYIPLIGLFTIFAFSITGKEERKPVLLFKRIFTLSALTLIYLNAWFQVALWKDTTALFQHSISAAGPTPAAHHLLGLGYAKKNEFELAIPEYKKALALFPDDKRVFNNLGLAFLSTGRPQKAIESFNRALKISPGYEYSRFHLGYAHFLKGEFEMATGELQATVSLNPLYVKAWYFLGRSLAAQGKEAGAKAAFEKATSINPLFTDAFIELAVLCYAQGKMREAAALFEKALKRDSGNSLALFNLGTIYAELREYEKAKVFLRRLLAKKSDADAHFNLGAIFMKEKNYREAAGQFKEALRIHPDDRDAKERYEIAVRRVRRE